MKNYVLLAGLAVMLCGGICRATTYNVTVNTAPIKGQTGFMVLDFVGGSTVQGNTATVSGFTTDSTLGAATPSGSVTGTLVPGPLTFSDSDFLNEWNQGVTFGSSTTFTLSVTNNFPAGAIPDAFSFYLLNSSETPLPPPIQPVPMRCSRSILPVQIHNFWFIPRPSRR